MSEPTARKRVRRARTGEPLEGRSSAPGSIPHRTPSDRIEAIEILRRLRMTATKISELLGMALSTVSLWLKRIGLGKRSRLAPPEPPHRYERARPGDLVHVDVKRLARISLRGTGHRMVGHRRSQVAVRGAGAKRRKVTGYEFVHVCVDDAARLAYAEVLPDEGAAPAVGLRLGRRSGAPGPFRGSRRGPAWRLPRDRVGTERRRADELSSEVRESILPRNTLDGRTIATSDITAG